MQKIQNEEKFKMKKKLKMKKIENEDNLKTKKNN